MDEEYGLAELEADLHRLVRAGLLLVRDRSSEPEYRVPPKFVDRNWMELALATLEEEDADAKLRRVWDITSPSAF